MKCLVTFSLALLSGLVSGSGDTHTKGIIAYFEAPACPPGWLLYRNATGRVIIGTGDYSGTSEDGRAESKSYTLFEMGGELEHKLTSDELPSHSHANPPFDQLLEVSCSNTAGTVQPGCDKPDITTSNTMGGGGLDMPHNILQPYLVLTCCIKDIDEDFVTREEVTVLEDLLENVDGTIVNFTQRADLMAEDLERLQAMLSSVNGTVGGLDPGLPEDLIRIMETLGGMNESFIEQIMNIKDTIDDTVEKVEMVMDTLNLSISDIQYHAIKIFVELGKINRTLTTTIRGAMVRLDALAVLFGLADDGDGESGFGSGGSSGTQGTETDTTLETWLAVVTSLLVLLTGAFAWFVWLVYHHQFPIGAGAAANSNDKQQVWNFSRGVHSSKMAALRSTSTFSPRSDYDSEGEPVGS